MFFAAVDLRKNTIQLTKLYQALLDFKAIPMPTPLQEFLSASTAERDMLSLKEAFGPFVIEELHLDRQDGEGIVQIYPDPNITR